MLIFKSNEGFEKGSQIAKKEVIFKFYGLEPPYEIQVWFQCLKLILNHCVEYLLETFFQLMKTDTYNQKHGIGLPRKKSIFGGRDSGFLRSIGH